MEKDEEALLKGIGFNQEKAKRSERYIKTTQRYRSEIEKSYKENFLPDHIEVKAVHERLLDRKPKKRQSRKKPPRKNIPISG
ncbi:hypothetical protein [Dethiosulfatarculus sandiegensis]|uniref:hypothetical protein n=1 Tax=Dethiosulfatarculus sandiegensis TaxID=1429043 RepID=UPI0012E2FB24|nr:hypothetical protein [Dethiosulfatarculus sandiegensis]